MLSLKSVLMTVMTLGTLSQANAAVPLRLNDPVSVKNFVCFGDDPAGKIHRLEVFQGQTLGSLIVRDQYHFFDAGGWANWKPESMAADRLVMKNYGGLNNPGNTARNGDYVIIGINPDSTYNVAIRFFGADNYDRILTVKVQIPKAECYSAH